MDKYIEEVGPHNVVQICTDNASSMKAAVDIITDRYSYIYFQGCDESVVGRLGEGDVDERGGEEVEDNHQVYKETAHAARRF
jgi:hypothetical protein